MLSTLFVKTVVRGYHVYKVLWERQVGEIFIVVHKTGNKHDRHAMVVGSTKTTLSASIASVCATFHTSGVLKCTLIRV